MEGLSGKMIPVYRGAASALTSEGFTGSHYHGNDGLGDTDLEIDVQPQGMLQPVDATRGLIDMTFKHPGEITLVALGPLTNIALALKIDPDFGKRLKNVTIMGGNTEGKGNAAFACAEFNFGCDPEAAQLVLNGLHTPIAIFPWEINLSDAGQPWEWHDRWTQTDTTKGQFIKAISQKPVQVQREIWKNPIFMSCDMNAMATVVEPGIITEIDHVYATVEIKGQFTRGMMVCDWRGIFNKDKNVIVIKKIDTTTVRELFDRIVLDD